MKRSSHSSSHAAMLFSEQVKRRECGRIADHARDLPATCSVGGLTLGSRFRLGFQLGGQKFAGFHDFSATEKASVVRGHVEADAVHNCGAVELCDGGGRGRVSGTRAADVVGAGSDGEGLGVVHGLLRGLTMERSLHVTSDTSTTVRRLLICLLHNA